MSELLSEKRILITGAAAGIGLGIARACVNEGASLVVSDIGLERVADATRNLTDDPSRIQAVALDVSRQESVREFFASAGSTVGRIDGVVNNAGLTLDGDFLEFPEEDLERLWSTNLRSVFLVCQQAARLMKEQGGGAIVNIASNHAAAGIPGYEMYAATKGGVAAMTRAMCWSLGKHGIRVNTLSPGLTHTETVAGMVEARPDLAAGFAAMHASGRYATVDEIGATAAFLLSDRASAIYGAEIVADHGLSALLCRSEDIK
ncbi:MAG: SDR family oxidoreductase [Pseudomonadota bacterium]